MATLLAGVSTQARTNPIFFIDLPRAQAEWSFPLGGMTKPEVRDHARRFGFALADKHESQEICFVGQEGYAATVEKILGEGGREGNFVHVDGKVIGKHQGIHRYTIGQRKGLGISWHEPLYVVDIDAQQGAVWVGPRSATRCLAPLC